MARAKSTSGPLSPRRRPARGRRQPPAPSDGLEDLKGLPLFAAVVAHELRNPLSAVKIALQTLERHAVLPSKDDTRLRIALREVGTIERVLTDMLDWARPAAIRVQPTHPSEIVEAVRERLRALFDSTDLHFEGDLPAGLLLVEVDRLYFCEALAELVKNAVDASPSGGTVRITVTQTDAGTRFTVTDEGSGLTDEDCARAFDPFFSRRARGVGLGLPRAQEVVRRHGGTITLATRRTGGARATIFVPRSVG